MAFGTRDLALDSLHRLLADSSGGPRSDRELLDRYIVSRDEAAFAALVQRHGGLVLGICRRCLRCRQDAEDAFQATFIALARQAVSLRKQESLSCWLHSVAYRTAGKLRREAGRRNRVPPLPAPESEDVLTELSARELLSLLDHGLAVLPDKFRAPLVMCYLEGQTQDEAAVRLGWPRGTLKGRLERGRELLRGWLRRRGVTFPAALAAGALVRPSFLPGALATDTARGVCRLVAGRQAGSVSARAIWLAGVGLSSGLAGKRKIMAALLGVVALLGAGLGWAALKSEPRPSGSGGAAPLPDGRGSDLRSKNKATARLDRHGDPLPPGALARLGTTRLRPGGRPNLLRMAADGKALLSATWRGTSDIRISWWCTATGAALRHCDMQPGWAYAYAVSPDERSLAAIEYDKPGDRFRVVVRDLATGQPKRVLNGLGNISHSHALVFAPDGKRVAGADPGGIRLWDLASGNEVCHFRDSQGSWRCLAFAPDGKTLASGSVRHRLVLWDVDRGQARHTLPGHTDMIGALAFAPDGKTLASAADADPKVRLWDVATGKLRGSLEGPRGSACLAFSPDGRMLASGDSWEMENRRIRHYPVRLWDVATGKQRRRFKGHLYGVYQVAFVSGGRQLASAGADGAIRVWDLATGKDLLPLTDHEGYLTSLTFAPDGQSLVTTGVDGWVRSWDPSTGKSLRRWAGKLGATFGGLVAPDARTLVRADPEGTVQLCDLATGNVVRRLRGTRGSRWYRFSADGRFLASGGWEAPEVGVWEVGTGKELGRVGIPGGAMPFAFFLPGGRELLVVTMAAVRRGDTKAHASAARVWDLGGGKELRRWAMPGQMAPFACSPDGRTLVTVNDRDGRLHLWDVARGRERYRAALPSFNRIFTTAFSPDGRTLAFGDNTGLVFLLETASGRLRRRLDGHRSYVQSLAFSPDGRMLASASANDPVGLVWNVGGVSARDLRAGDKVKVWWKALADADAFQADRAMRRLTGVPRQAVAYLQERLRPVGPADREQIAGLVADLENPRFAVRQRSMKALVDLREVAGPFLRQALEAKPSPELHRRLTKLLEEPVEPVVAPAELQRLRGVEVLERIGTREACQILEKLAQGAPSARMSREARASLDRVAHRMRQQTRPR
jgi:RNA polymerase sigma factor (sigma-70 family)